jgi:hypothetical protein
MYTAMRSGRARHLAPCYLSLFFFSLFGERRYRVDNSHDGKLWWRSLSEAVMMPTTQANYDAPFAP